VNKKAKKRMIVSIIIVVFHVLGFLSSIHAVMSTRTSQGAIAWVVSLNTFPYVAVPAYWVFGRSTFRGYVTARQTGDLEIQHIVQTASAESAELRSTAVRTGATRAAEQLAEMPALRGNTVRLLIDGDATFASIFEGIEAAEDYVLVQFYIVKDDGLGRELQSRLIAKAQEGVRVLFLYDEVGSYKLPGRYIEELRDAGVEAEDFHSRKGPRNRFQINFRNHRKIVVADGHTAWVGGHNVGDEYLGKDPKFGGWRDTHVKIEGPAALAVQLSFFEDWHWATDSIPDLDWAPQHVDEAGSTGVKFYRYTEGFLHEKAMLVDHQVAAVGTANFDNRSFRLNFEITAFIADEIFAAEVEHMFLDDFAASREMQTGDFADRSFWFKLGVRLTRLTAPVL